MSFKGNNPAFVYTLRSSFKFDESKCIHCNTTVANLLHHHISGKGGKGGFRGRGKGGDRDDQKKDDAVRGPIKLYPVCLNFFECHGFPFYLSKNCIDCPACHAPQMCLPRYNIVFRSPSLTQYATLFFARSPLSILWPFFTLTHASS